MSIMRPMSSAACALTTLALCVEMGIPDGRAAAQGTTAPTLVEIVAPAAEDYVSGQITLRAAVEPASSVTALAFFADGRQVCLLEQPPFDCSWDAGADVREHQIRLVVSTAEHGRVVRTVRTQGLHFIEKVDVDAVQVTVTVADEKGEFVAGLPRSAFHVFEDGQRQAIGHFTADDVPLELIVAVDISGSMTPSMPRLKVAVKEFLAAVPAHNEVTLLGFNDSIFALTRRNTDPADRVRAVDRLAPWGATALYDVILRGIEMVGRQAGRKAIIVFSDGEDQGSHVALQDVARRLESSDVTLYMIAQGRGVSQEYLRKIMTRLTATTGGRAIFTESIDELHTAFAELLDELSHQYLLGYQPTNTKRDDAWRAITVKVQGYSDVRARQGYRAVPQK
jgi:VWFA-related protein